jgi:tRNA modification GTPase
VLRVNLDLSGFAVHLYDTAGLRETDDVVEREGIKRTHQSIGHAHLLLLLSDNPEEDWQALQGTFAGPVIRVRTKADLSTTSSATGADAAISVRTGEGVTELLALIAAQLPDIEGGGALALPTRQRHVAALEAAWKSISDALNFAHAGLDVQAEHLRRAGQSLGKVTGRVDVENLLDVIFSEFCIGK